MLTLESLIFLLSSLISFSIVYFQVPKNILFVILSILLAGLLVFFGKFTLTFLQQKNHRPVLLAGLFFCTLFIQILLIATGGFFSAFIIVLHLLTLAMSLIFNVRSAVFYLLLSVAVLASMIFFDPQTILLFNQDPWSFLLHGISFLVIIPLAHMMVSTYHLKDALTKVLSEHLKTKQLQDESIFRGIGEFVLILDKKLNVVFANEVVKRSLGLENSGIVGENVFSLLPLESDNGSEVNAQTLSIDQAIADRSAHIVKGFHLQSQQGGRNMPVTIQIRPIYETNGDLKQIILVMIANPTGNDNRVDIGLISNRRALLSEELERELKLSSKSALGHYLLLMAQVSDTMLLAQIGSMGISEQKNLVNNAQYLQDLTQKMKKFTDNLSVNIDLQGTQESLVHLATQIGNIQNYSLYSYTKRNLLCSISINWMNEILERIIRLFSLISLQTTKQIFVRTGFNDKGELVTLIAIQAPLDIGFSAQELFIQNYGTLQKHPALLQGSGLEGLIIKQITNVLNYPLELNFNQKTSFLSCTIILPHPTV